MRKRISVFLAALLLLLCLASPALALDDDEFDGYAADTLTVKVGYFGGPYYEKHVFTLDELWSMDLVYADYTFIDNMPSVVIDHVVGVRLADVMDAAGIDLNSIQYFYFYTKDKTDSYYSHPYTKASLIDTPRYCFYSLPDNFDDETGLGNEYSASYGEPVETLLALADDWTRTIAGATFGSDYLNLNTNTRFRLVFGQTDTDTRNATESAKWIHEIVVELGGAPTLTLDASVLEGEVGSVLRTEAFVTGDATVLANSPIVWSSSDDSIASVDESGNITVHSEGTAVITAETAGVSASVTVNGTASENPGPGGATGGQGDDPQPGPAQTEPPAETAAPVETASPAETAAPVETPIPAETEPPTETAEPVETVPPAETAAPSETAAPVETAAPEPSPPQEPEPEPPPASALHVKPVTVAERETGGVQNWRDTEMSETAQELPNIETRPALLTGMGIGAGGLLILSAAVYAVSFYKNIGKGKKRK